MGWHLRRRGGLVLAAVLGSGCSAGVTNGAGTFGGVTVATTNADDSADTGADGATSGTGEDDADTGVDASADASDGGETMVGETAQDATAADDTASEGPAGACGDDVVQGGESCDGSELGGSCTDYGFDDGILVCDAECNHITDACFTCGDGDVSIAEVCDGDDFGGATCLSLGFGGGALLCSVDCQTVIDSGCQALPSCGDGQLNGGELCDGNDLGGSTCVSEGFDMGALGCTAACTLDLTNCEDDLSGCGQQGDFCVFDENDLQSTCCPAGVGGNVLGICDIIFCV